MYVYKIPVKGFSWKGFSFLKVFSKCVFFIFFSIFMYLECQINSEQNKQTSNFWYLLPIITKWRQYGKNCKWKPSLKFYPTICTPTCWHFPKIGKNWSSCLKIVVLNHFSISIFMFAYVLCSINDYTSSISNFQKLL